MSSNERIGGMLIFAVTFLGVFAILVAFIPSGFFEGQSSLNYNLPPSEWNGIDLQSFKETWNTTDLGDYWNTFDIGGRNLEFIADSTYEYLQLFHKYGLGLGWREAMDWYSRDGVLRSYAEGGVATLHGEELDTEFSTYDDLKFIVKCQGAGAGSSRFSLVALLYFNTTTYDTPTEAWAADQLDILFGINFDEVNTSYNAWDLIAQLLFFQSPEVLGMTGIAATIINFVIATPLWICTAYIAYRLIIMVIPLLGG